MWAQTPRRVQAARTQIEASGSLSVLPCAISSYSMCCGARSLKTFREERGSHCLLLRRDSTRSCERMTLQRHPLALRPPDPSVTR